MTVLYVFRSLAVWGGIERIMVDKMNHLVKMYGYEVFMLTSDQGDHPVPYHLDEKVHLKDLGIRFHQKYQYGMLKRFWVARHLRRLYEHRLAEHIKQIQPDIIVCTTADDIELLVKLKGSTPLVVESHSICLRTIEQGHFWLSRKWYRYHYLKTLSHVDTVVALTEGDAAEWQKVCHHVTAIPNIVHQNGSAYSSLENKHAIFVGRFDYQKRPLLLVHIWEKIHQLYPDWQLDIYGEGELQQQLERAVALANANIVVHPPTSDIFACYRESSLLLSTSLFEPFGLVIPEAMSCGLPVVAFDCPYGPKDIISDGVNGFLINNDDVEAFVEKLSRLMGDSSLRKKIGAQAVEVAERYKPTYIMPQWKSLFEKLLSE